MWYFDCLPETVLRFTHTGDMISNVSNFLSIKLYYKYILIS